MPPPRVPSNHRRSRSRSRDLLRRQDRTGYLSYETGDSNRISRQHMLRGAVDPQSRNLGREYPRGYQDHRNTPLKAARLNDRVDHNLTIATDRTGPKIVEPAVKLKVAVEKYLPPETFVDQPDIVSMPRFATTGIPWPGRSNTKVHCVRCGENINDHAKSGKHWMYCRRHCRICGSDTDHFGTFCPWIYCSIAWWKRHFDCIPDNVRIRPSGPEAAVLWRSHNMEEFQFFPPDQERRIYSMVAPNGTTAKIPYRALHPWPGPSTHETKRVRSPTFDETEKQLGRSRGSHSEIPQRGYDRDRRSFDRNTEKYSGNFDHNADKHGENFDRSTYRYGVSLRRSTDRYGGSSRGGFRHENRKSRSASPTRERSTQHDTEESWKLRALRAENEVMRRDKQALVLENLWLKQTRLNYGTPETPTINTGHNGLGTFPTGSYGGQSLDHNFCVGQGNNYGLASGNHRDFGPNNGQGYSQSSNSEMAPFGGLPRSTQVMVQPTGPASGDRGIASLGGLPGGGQEMAQRGIPGFGQVPYVFRGTPALEREERDFKQERD